MITLRVDGIGKLNERRIKEAFSQFGNVGDCYIPMDLHTKGPRDFAFVRFRYREEAQAAVNGMHGGTIDGNKVTVEDSTQKHVFSQDTGYITNEALDSIPPKAEDFDSSMPDSHYNSLMLSKRDMDSCVTIRVRNLSLDTTEDELYEIFAMYGEIFDVKRAFNKGKMPLLPLEHAFVKMPNRKEAAAAIAAVEGVWLNGNQLHCEESKQLSYFSQNENRELPSALEEDPDP
jgi:RNA recognition motif-containing protein